MARSWTSILRKQNTSKPSWIRQLVTGSLFRIADSQYDSVSATIQHKVDAMRALAKDSQIAAALSYFATDSTLLNTEGQVIWATSDNKHEEVAEVVNELLKRWKVNQYARDHILELATIGNLYIPTSDLYKDEYVQHAPRLASLDGNSIQDEFFDIIPSYKLDPKNVIHLYKLGDDVGYVYQEDDNYNQVQVHSPESIIHFSLGGMLGEYQFDALTKDGKEEEYDVKFATPLFENAVRPTQTLSLLEDAVILSSLCRTVKFINVECGNANEEEITDILENIKSVIEQNLSVDTNTGDAQSFVNPQSPNNLIYLPKIKGADAVSVTDLNMAESTEQDNKLLEYYLNKKLSVLGVPKEALNFASNEGLGGAGSVLSQRSAIYANSLQRLKTAYIEGWTCAIDTYAKRRGLSGIIGTYQLHMADTITTQSTIQFERRDAAVGQASNIIQMLKDLGVKDADTYRDAISEILLDVLPGTSGKATSWDVDVEGGEDNETF